MRNASTSASATIEKRARDWLKFRVEIGCFPTSVTRITTDRKPTPREK
jgi:hypothetical protein